MIFSKALTYAAAVVGGAAAGALIGVNLPKIREELMRQRAAGEQKRKAEEAARILREQEERDKDRAHVERLAPEAQVAYWNGKRIAAENEWRRAQEERAKERAKRGFRGFFRALGSLPGMTWLMFSARGLADAIVESIAWVARQFKRGAEAAQETASRGDPDPQAAAA